MSPVVLQVASLVVVAVAYGPLLWDHGLNLWSKPHYQHFPFVLFASVLLIQQQWSRLPRRSTEPAEAQASPHRWLQPTAYLFAWLTLLLAYQAPSPLLAAISFLLLLGGWLHRLSSQLGRQFPTQPWLLLWLMLPPPLGLDQRLIETLQRVSSQLSSKMLDLLAINHLMSGNTLVLPDKQLFVDDACSGIVSVISIATYAAIYSIWRQRQNGHILLLIAAGAGWATLLNVLRITSIALAHVWAGLDWSEGTPHTLIAVATFSLSILGLICTDWFFQAVLAEIGPRWMTLSGEPLRYGAWLVRLWDRLVADQEWEQPTTPALPIDWRQQLLHSGALFGLLPLLLFAGLGVTQFTPTSQPQGVVAHVPRSPFPESLLLAKQLQEAEMPERLLGLTLKQVNHSQRHAGDDFGEHSVIYEYVDPNGNPYLVSCDFPYTGGWHELSVCYRGAGWELVDRQTMTLGQPQQAPSQHPGGQHQAREQQVSQPSHETPPYSIAQLQLDTPEGTRALATFCACYPNGEPLAAPPSGFWANVVRAFSRQQSIDPQRRSWQLQVLAVRPQGLTERDRQLSLELLHTIRGRIQTVIKTATPSSPTP